MANLDVVRVDWTGGPGGPGTSTFYLTPGTHNLTPLKDFYGLLAGIIPNSWTIQVQNSGATIDAATGNLVGSWAAAAVAQIPGSNTGDYASGVGAVVRWDTGVVMDGRTIRGHTYLVPIYAAAFDVNGSLDDSQKALIQNTTTTTVTALTGQLNVWHRPRKASEHFGSARAGAAVPITGGTVIDRPAILRSRRN